MSASSLLRNPSMGPVGTCLPLASALIGASALLWSTATLAADASSRITQVKVYPGSATVERLVRVAAGTRSITLRCLPLLQDAQSLQVTADANVRLGEASINTLERNLEPACSTPLDDQIRDAQDKVAAAKAESEALELSNSYLKTVAGSSPKEAYSGPGTPGSAAISVTTEALRRSAQDTLLRLHQAKRKQETAEQALAALSAERDRLIRTNQRVTNVTVNLATDRDSDVRLSYQIKGAGWSPSYRATLDSATNVVHLERLASVAQSTGEDWSGVQLTLSTGQPTRATSGRLPNQWTLDVAPPPPPPAPSPVAGAPRPAMAASRIVQVESADKFSAEMAQAFFDLPRFDVQSTDTAFATEFNVPQRITVPSGGQRVSLSLGTHDVRAQLLTRASPAVEPAAYLVAQLPTLPGIWPTANVALYRDNAYVGQGTLNNNDNALSRIGLSFGRDERVIVTAEPQQQNAASAGFTGANVERKVQHAYRIDNRHQRPVSLQVLEAAPISRNEQIEVKSQYEPAPAETAWNDQPGLMLWSATLAPASSQRFVATHTLRYPKEARLQESQ